MKFKKAIIYTGLTLLIFTIVVFAVFIFTLLIYSNKIDYSTDEMLFDSAKNSSTSRFFADKNPSDDIFEPIEITVSSLSVTKKYYYPLESMSKYVIEGIISVEDKKFYDHSGIDVKRTFAAAINYFTRRSKRFGASTITQQVIKNISGDNQNTVSRKISEILRAYHIEKIYEKEDILELYLNIIPLSDNVCGVGAASRLYFNKEPISLNAKEAATIIGITNAPSKYNPKRNPDECIKKRNSVLSIMYNDGVINKDEYEESVNSPLDVCEYEFDEGVDSWFIETVINDLTEDLSKLYNVSERTAEMIIANGGLNVYTTMDINIQSELESYYSKKENFSNEILNGLNYSTVVCESTTNNLVAIIGGVGEKKANRIINHATINHVPGSILKPLALYAPLIDEGKIRWSTVFDDVPVEYSRTNNKINYYPKNSPNRYDGLINVCDALKKSKNTVAVRLYNILGAEKIFDYLYDNYSFDSLVKKKRVNGRVLTDLSASPLALGQLTYGIPLRKITEAYTVFPNEGKLVSPTSYFLVTDVRDNEIIRKNKNEKFVLKKETARIMNKLLSEVVKDGSAKTIGIDELIDTAGKTGTSGNSNDKWFIGYTPYYTIGIWSGYDDNKKSVNCDPTHLDIWDDTAYIVHKRIIEKNTDELKAFSSKGLKVMEFCYDSGLLTKEECGFDPRGERIGKGYFSENDNISEECNIHVIVDYDYLSEGVSMGYCPEKYIKKVALLDVKNRLFPTDIFITDGEFVYKEIENKPISHDYSVPYFYPWYDYDTPGRSKKSKQFNSGCYIHY